MVLHAPPCSPALGPARRHLHLFEEIARRHAVSIVTLGSSAERATFECEHAGRYERATFVTRRPRAIELLVALWYVATGRSAFRRLYFPPLQRAVDRAIAAGRFDAVYFSTVLLGCYRVPSGMRVVGDAHNVEHEVLARAAAVARSPLHRAYFRLQARATRRHEEHLARKFSQVWATSARDAEQFAAARGDRCVAVVPNGIRCAQAVGDGATHDEPMRSPNAPCDVRPPTQCAAAPTLLFVGLMSYFPNDDAVAFLLDDILPLITARIRDARVLVVGANPSRRLRSRASPMVSIVGRVASVDPYFAQATAFLVPLRSGGGTRVKVLEAMAHRVPVVSTTMGCEGLSVRDGESVLLADTPDTFADAVVRICRDPALAHRLTAAGADLVRAQYDWRRIGESVHSLLGEHAFA